MNGSTKAGENDLERPVKLRAACMHLRHKLMYCDERQTTPGMVDDSSTTRVFFCIQSHDSLGPDGQPAAPKLCSTDRCCYCSGG